MVRSFATAAAREAHTSSAFRSPSASANPSASALSSSKRLPQIQLKTVRLLAAADGIIDISSASVASAVSSSAPRAAATSATAAPACFVADLLSRGENLDYEDEYQAKKSEFEKQIGSGFRKKKKVDISFKLKVGNASVKRLLSGAFAGAVSRTVVAPLETIRTHLMVGNGGHATVPEVFGHIMSTEGWKGLFRGNGVNVIRVAPSKAIELFAYDTVKKTLDKTSWVPSHIPIPTSSIAGATAGVCSTLCTYPLELLKTRLTVQRGVYKNLLDACIKICQEEGPKELYRGLTPSLIGVIPYSATNYFAYDFLKKLYKKISKDEHVGNLQTLLIGSAAGAFASAATFPLEVARKQMQVGALSGRPVYDNLFHALSTLLEQQGPAGLYRGLGPSCIKLIPAAGISFMCYEACKRILIEGENN